MKTLYFDEAGMSGNNLMDNVQPFFCYLGIEDKYKNLISKFKTMKQEASYPLNIEQKGSKLAKSKTGQKFLLKLWDNFGEQTKFVFHDKKYALACKIFEYIYEPVFSSCNTLFYQIKFHKFFANNLYKLFLNCNYTAEELFKNFNSYIINRTRTPIIQCLPTNNVSNDNFISYFIKFCTKFNKDIASDIDFNDSDDRFLLDLTGTSLHSLLGEFSENSTEKLLVYCDKSEPLKNMDTYWKPFINNSRLEKVFLGDNCLKPFNLKKKPIVANSKDVIGLQLADMLVSSLFHSKMFPEDPFSKLIEQKSKQSFVLQYSVLPDPQLTDTFDSFEIKNFNKILELINVLDNKDYIIKNIRYISNDVLQYQISKSKCFKPSYFI